MQLSSKLTQSGMVEAVEILLARGYPCIHTRLDWITLTAHVQAVLLVGANLVVRIYVILNMNVFTLS
jgi:hypothetical protein